MAKSIRIPKLARRFVRAAHALTMLKRPPYWVSVHDVVRFIGGGDEKEIDEAIEFAVAQNLLKTDGGRPPHSLCVTYEGVKLANRP